MSGFKECGSLTGTNCPRCRKNSCGWQQSLRGLQKMCFSRNFEPLVKTARRPEDRAERRDRFESRSSGSGAQTSPVQPRNTENSMSPEELVLRGREFETERSTWPHRRISRKRAVEEETSSSVKKERIASSDLSLIRPPSESPLPPVVTRWLVCETRDSLRTAQMNRARELAVVPWSGASGEKRSLDVFGCRCRTTKETVHW